jgi:hypothetical protein
MKNWIKQIFCLHYWEKSGYLGRLIKHTCIKCGKNFYQDPTFEQPPISYIKEGGSNG